jgi:hypothetical protein
MPDAPWRCSQCGTVNEPAANSCRTCGRWPSLFDLQDGAVGTDELSEPEAFHGERAPSMEPPYVHEAPSADEARTAEPMPLPDEVQRVDESPAPAMPTDTEGSGAPWRGPEPPIPNVPQGTWVRRASRLIVPLLILLYVLVTVARNH